ncbi:hypothetical protein [Rhizobium sp. CSW-27]|uniref:hypothetical protein n=1 Tax=Rhizobium sp. CSW-27 TaxID=2839985 RepID=UPI001C017D24|nr:hypothetical protein [Rhizobium sp. CSW-27]MBT9368307.1 hypothetical protein [Rhizobium sp. CSW-27]
MGRTLLLLGGLLASGSALAQTSEPSTQSGGASETMAHLLSREYEIKAAVPNGTKLIVFLQKGTSAYACEFVSVTKTRCGSVN